MKRKFVLDENTIILAHKLEDEKGSKDSSALGVLVDIAQKFIARS